jgi:hypothetical protein
MELRNTVLFALAFAAIGAAAGVGFSKDEPAKPMSEQEMMMKMMEWAQPGPMHKHLEALVGDWKVAGKMYSSSGAMPFEGEATNNWILGGRFVESRYEGPFMGEEFEGIGVTGYDNGKKEYQSHWIMTMATGIGSTTGTYDAETRCFTFKGSAYMPDGTTHTKREVMTIKGKNEIHSVVYSAAPGGKEQKEMEMTYTRVTDDEEGMDDEDK